MKVNKNTTLTRLVANKVREATGKGRWMLFNDKLTGNGRSLKVPGWTKTEYLLAKSMLEDIGCRAHLMSNVRKQPWSGYRSGCESSYRLYVYENTRPIVDVILFSFLKLGEVQLQSPSRIDLLLDL